MLFMYGLFYIYTAIVNEKECVKSIANNKGSNLEERLDDNIREFSIPLTARF